MSKGGMLDEQSLVMKDTKEIEKNRDVEFGSLTPRFPWGESGLQFLHRMKPGKHARNRTRLKPSFFFDSLVCFGARISIFKRVRTTAAQRAVPNHPDCATARV